MGTSEARDGPPGSRPGNPPERDPVLFRGLDGSSVPVPSRELDELSRALNGEILFPGTPGFRETCEIWNGIFQRVPAALVRCRGTADVVHGIRFARSHGILTAVKSGGHSVTGHALVEGGLVLDLSPMRGVWVDPAHRVAHVQGGALLRDVDAETQRYGLATPLGVVSKTGVAGLTLGGGYGHLRRKWGLTIDNLLGAEVVTAEGEVLEVDGDHHPDLFWALRGGGGNFGVVTRFDYRLHPVGPRIFQIYRAYPLAAAWEIVRTAREFLVHQAPDEISAEFQFAKIPFGDAFDPSLHGKRVVLLRAVHAGTPEEGRRDLRPLLELGPFLYDRSGEMSYVDLQRYVDTGLPNGGRYYSTGLLVDRLGDDLLKILFDEYSRVGFDQSAVTGIWHTGGAISRVPVPATPYIGRTDSFMIVIDSAWTDPSEDRAQIAWGRNLKRQLLERSVGAGDRGYINFQPGEDVRSEAEAAYGENIARLRRVKRLYDPSNFFRRNHNILPEEGPATDLPSTGRDVP